jgi:hypothetical protein
MYVDDDILSLLHRTDFTASQSTMKCALGRYSQRQSLGSVIPGFFKDDSLELISGLSGSNDLEEESCSLIGYYGGQAYDSGQ